MFDCWAYPASRIWPSSFFGHLVEHAASNKASTVPNISDEQRQKRRSHQRKLDRGGALAAEREMSGRPKPTCDFSQSSSKSRRKRAWAPTPGFYGGFARETLHFSQRKRLTGGRKAAGRGAHRRGRERRHRCCRRRRARWRIPVDSPSADKPWAAKNTACTGIRSSLSPCTSRTGGRGGTLRRRQTLRPRALEASPGGRNIRQPPPAPMAQLQTKHATPSSCPG